MPATKPAPAKKQPPRPPLKPTPKPAPTTEPEPVVAKSAFHVEQWPLDRIIPYEKNARRIPHAAIDKVALSLQEFGWRQPIVVDKAGVIVVGHTRLLAAQKLEYTHAPVHVATDLTPAQIAAYRLMDNRSHQETEWDYDLLKPELFDLGKTGFDMKLTGFDLDEISRLFKPQEFHEHYTDVGDVSTASRHCPNCGALLGRTKADKGEQLNEQSS